MATLASEPVTLEWVVDVTVSLNQAAKLLGLSNQRCRRGELFIGCGGPLCPEWLQQLVQFGMGITHPSRTPVHFGLKCFEERVRSH
ncbi:hypothetical protein [Pseudorhizobium flavum]|uniref:Uncharacterized protein n=1 Tax=Pseudorhizobium flavum TaxID=1335061 RepID=A0A7X0DE33_9HYPH|nr:hypothetical protein [Pseudorhizobium flavum]MBB6181563.1 hypothetical protein [Pseudorhizobium flavum]